MNTLENKAKLFALYYDQEILTINLKSTNLSTPRPYRCLTEWETILPETYLQLKPLSSITDEDAIELAKNQYHNIDYHNAQEGKLIAKTNSYMLSPIDYDYLRSKGYALPWNGITVEDQVKYGWVKLIEK